MNECPTPEQLARYLRTEIPGESEEELLDHLNRCERCRAALEELASHGDSASEETPDGLPARRQSDSDSNFTLQLEVDPNELLQQSQRPNRAPDTEIATGGKHRGAGAGPLPVQIGQYRIVRELGRGGMGVVYLARQESLKRDVGLKVLTAGPHSDPDDLLRFRVEAETVAALKHPNIVQVYEVGEQNGTAFLAMEYVGGGTLSDWLDGQPQDAFAAANLMAILARAMQHAHAQGVVHRDLKPGNVLLDRPDSSAAADHPPGTSTMKIPGRKRLPDDKDRSRKRRLAALRNPKITDFGLARRMDRADRLTLTGVAMGTPSYMAPEQATGKDELIGPATDIYALGVILYECVTGRPPFTGATPLATMEQLCDQEPVPPRRLQPDCPRDLETICLKSLEKDPRRRYASAALLADDLERFLAGRAISARPTPFWESAWKWAKRRPSVAALSAIIILVTLLGFYLVTAEWLRANAEWSRAEGEARRAGSALKEAEERRKQAEEIEANLAFNQGFTLCEQGEPARGMLWLARALERAEKADARYLERASRVNLAAWAQYLSQTTRVLKHGATVRDLAVDPTGRYLASAGYDGQVRIWDLTTGQETGPSLDHPRSFVVVGDRDLRSIAWSRDGASIVTGHGDGKVRIWDPATRKQRRLPIVSSDTEAWKVEFGPSDATIFAMIGDGQLHRWDARTGEPIGKPIAHSKDRRGYFTFDRSPDGSIVATGGRDGFIRIHQTGTGKLLGEERLSSLVEALSFCPDGRRLIAGTRDGTLHAWDFTTGRLIDLAPQGGSVVALAFSPDGRTFATGARNGHVRLWDAETLLELGEVHRGDHEVNALTFLPTGELLAVGENDGSIRILSVPQSAALGPPIRHSHPFGGEIHTVAFGRDGKSLLSISTHSGQFFDLETAKPVGASMFFGTKTTSGAQSLDGKRIGLGTYFGYVALFDADTQKQRLLSTNSMTDTVWAMAFNPDGTRWLTCSDRRKVPFVKSGPLLWDLTRTPTEPHSILKDLSATVRHAVFSPDGRTLLLGCQDRKARFWDVETDRQIGPELEHAGAVGAVAFSPDGTLALTGSRDGTARLWDAKTGELMFEPLRHRGEVNAVAFSPDGSLLLTGSDDGMARFWDPASGRPLGPPLRHPDGVRSLAFAPDGKSVATGTRNLISQRWAIPPAPIKGSPEKVQCWVELQTGLELVDRGVARPLTPVELKQKRELFADYGE